MRLRTLSYVRRTKKAASLFLAQPTLTKRLQNLEQELDTELFLRSKNGISLTPMGEKTIETLRAVNRQLSDLRSFIQENRDYVGGTLTVASSLDDCKYCLPPVLEQYMHAFPNVTMKVTTAAQITKSRLPEAARWQSFGVNTDGTENESSSHQSQSV